MYRCAGILYAVLYSILTQFFVLQEAIPGIVLHSGNFAFVV